MTHSLAATRLAEILIPEGINRQGRASRLKTAYGEKTREGIADLIDNEFAACGPAPVALRTYWLNTAPFSAESDEKDLVLLSDYTELRNALAQAKYLLERNNITHPYIEGVIAPLLKKK